MRFSADPFKEQHVDGCSWIGWILSRERFWGGHTDCEEEDSNTAWRTLDLSWVLTGKIKKGDMASKQKVKVHLPTINEGRWQWRLEINVHTVCCLLIPACRWESHLTSAHSRFPGSSMVPASLCSSTATETSRYRLDGASKPAITCLLPQCPSHHLSPFTLLLIAHLITIDMTVIAGVCCRVAEKRIRNIYPFSQHKCVKVCSRFYEARSKTAAFTKSWGVNCWGIVRWLLPAHCVSLDRSTHRLLCWAETGVRKETISWWKVG